MTGLRSIAVKVVVIAITSMVLGLAIYNTMTNPIEGSTLKYRADFVDVSGLRVGDDIRLAGVRVGKVTGIEIGGSGAIVDFEVEEDNPPLANTKLVMRYQNLLGQKYISMVQPQKLGAELSPATMIPVARTDPGFDLTSLLNGFRPLFNVLKPEDMNTLASSIIKVLQGESSNIESLLQQTAQLTSDLADKDEVFSEVLDNLTPALVDLSGEGKRLRSTVTELRKMMTGLAKDRKDIGASIEGMSALLNATSELLVEADAKVPATVKKFRAVMEDWVSNRDAFVESLGQFSGAIEALGRASSYENALSVYFCSLDVDILGESLNTSGSRAGNYSETCR